MKNTLYSDIIIKTRELLALNDVEPIYDFESEDPNGFMNIIKRQDALMDELKTIAKKYDTLLGRTIGFPMGDGQAVYVVTKVNKKTVEITWVKYSDAWQDSRAGYQSLLDIEYATKQIKGQDRLAELFGKRGEKRVEA